MYDEKLFAVKAITAGAYGYISKECARVELIQAIRQVASRRPYISIAVAELLANGVMHAFRELPHKRLSKREFEIFILFANGESSTNIAAQLQRSVKTISVHKQNILRKMCMESISEMTRYAIAENLVVQPEVKC
jgi:DNA-binding NarL/FixJ family response regulator